VGKTTTIAKLAAGFRLEAKRRVALVTIDTFRIAAVQQLQAYAEIMDLPMEVVQNPDEMRPALDRLGDVDLVLIDTAGRSPRSDARIEQLRSMLRAAQPDETHLVLSTTSSRETIQNILDGFSTIRPTAAILTKLDESSQLAGTLAALEGRQIPVSYLTTGQQVPDDIETADALSLVKDLLSADVHTGRIPTMSLASPHTPSGGSGPSRTWEAA
jgi:flagellar biosynthesis protein FlhF